MTAKQKSSYMKQVAKMKKIAARHYNTRMKKAKREALAKAKAAARAKKKGGH